MEATVSSTHQIELNNRTLTDLRILGELPPQKLKAICGLIAAPGSTVKSVAVVPYSIKWATVGIVGSGVGYLKRCFQQLRGRVDHAQLLKA